MIAAAISSVRDWPVVKLVCDAPPKAQLCPTVCVTCDGDEERYVTMATRGCNRVCVRKLPRGRYQLQHHFQWFQSFLSLRTRVCKPIITERELIRWKFHKFVRDRGIIYTVMASYFYIPKTFRRPSEPVTRKGEKV